MPAPPNDTTARLDALEAHIAHQERVIGELNDVVIAQWQRIERLERHVSALHESVQAAPQREAPEPPPPHY